VDDVLQVLRADGCGLAGCGIFWITPLEQHGWL